MGKLVNYKLYNLQTKQICEGTNTVANVARNLGLPYASVQLLFKEEKTHVKYWVLYKNKNKISLDQLNKPYRARYKFYNTVTAQTFEGTMVEFAQIVGVAESHISPLVNGKITHVKKWVLYDKKDQGASLKPPKIRKYSDKIDFVHLITGERFNGTVYELSEKCNIPLGLCFQLAKGESNQTNNWTLLSLKQKIDEKQITPHLSLSNVQFLNVITNEVFEGKAVDFAKHIGVSKQAVNMLIHGKLKSLKNREWILRSIT